MHSLVTIKDHIGDDNLDWTFVEEIMTVLKPAEELTVKLQTVQYTPFLFAFTTPENTPNERLRLGDEPGARLEGPPVNGL